MIAKKKFKITQQFACFADVRTGTKMPVPVTLGVYESHQITASIQQAAKQHGIPALFLHASIIPVCLEGDL